MTSASAGFEVDGVTGSKKFSGATAHGVVSRTYLDTEATFGLEYVDTMNFKHGEYLYQWVWSTEFGGSEQCRGLPAARVASRAYTVQADFTPNCLPGSNADAKYTVCVTESTKLP